MSFDAIQRVWDDSKARGLARLVLLSLATHENQNGISWPSIDRLAEKTQVSRRQVIRIINELEEIQEIAILRSKGGHTSNFYCVLAGLSDSDQKVARVSLAGFVQSENDDHQYSDKVSPLEHNSSDKVSPLEHNSSDKVSPLETERGDIQDPRGAKFAYSSAIAMAPESLKESLNNESKEKSSGQSNVSLTLPNVSLTLPNVSLTPLRQPDPVDVWNFLSGEIYKAGGRAFFDTWIKTLEPIGWSGEVFQVKAVNNAQVEIVSERLGSTINQKIQGFVNHPTARVNFRLGGQLS